MSVVLWGRQQDELWGWVDGTMEGGTFVPGPTEVKGPQTQQSRVKNAF